jgi:hypothetical protein
MSANQRSEVKEMSHRISFILVWNECKFAVEVMSPELHDVLAACPVGELEVLYQSLFQILSGIMLIFNSSGIMISG